VPEPRLTIGMPVRNGERYLELAASSVLAQTFEDLELLIADNASTDGTAAICEELRRRDPRVRCVRHAENIGVAGNHNFTAENARGELFRWAAHDDLIEPTTLEKCVDLLDGSGPGTVLAFPRTEIIDEHGDHLMFWSEQGAIEEPTPSGRLRALLESPRGHLYGGFLTPFYGVMRTAVLRSTALHRYFYAADLVLLVELGLRGRFAEVGEPLYKRRQHAAQSGGWSSATELERDLWMNPGFRGHSMLRTRLTAGYVDAVLRAPMTPLERLRCLAAVGSTLRRNRTMRAIGGELVRAGRATVGARLGRAPDASAQR
jgi:glycosyltransferase involved in cell wall biosynthesis